MNNDVSIGGEYLISEVMMPTNDSTAYRGDHSWQEREITQALEWLNEPVERTG